jgi:hypothetical protein
LQSTGTALAPPWVHSTGKEKHMKLRRLTTALALAALCTAGVASAQTTAPTTPSTTPNDSTATPPNNAKVPPGTANPGAGSTGATPRANTKEGTKSSGSATHHNKKSSGSMNKSSSGSMNHSGMTNSGGASSEPSKTAPATGAGK